MVDRTNVGGVEHDINDTGAREMISPDVFSTAASYAAGDYCIYNNALYKFTAAKSAGAWDASKVAATNIAAELSALNSSLIVKSYVIDFANIPGSAGTTTTTDISLDGHTALGVVGWANGGNTGFYPYMLCLLGNNLRCDVRNVNSGAITNANITVLVLYKKYL